MTKRTLDLDKSLISYLPQQCWSLAPAAFKTDGFGIIKFQTWFKLHDSSKVWYAVIYNYLQTNFELEALIKKKSLSPFNPVFTLHQKNQYAALKLQYQKQYLLFQKTMLDRQRKISQILDRSQQKKDDKIIEIPLNKYLSYEKLSANHKSLFKKCHSAYSFVDDGVPMKLQQTYDWMIESLAQGNSPQNFMVFLQYRVDYDKCTTDSWQLLYQILKIVIKSEAYAQQCKKFKWQPKKKIQPHISSGYLQPPVTLKAQVIKTVVGASCQAQTKSAESNKKKGNTQQNKQINRRGIFCTAIRNTLQNKFLILKDFFKCYSYYPKDRQSLSAYSGLRANLAKKFSYIQGPQILSNLQIKSSINEQKMWQINKDEIFNGLNPLHYLGKLQAYMRILSGLICVADITNDLSKSCLTWTKHDYGGNSKNKYSLPYPFYTVQLRLSKGQYGTAHGFGQLCEKFVINQGVLQPITQEFDQTHNAIVYGSKGYMQDTYSRHFGLQNALLVQESDMIFRNMIKQWRQNLGILIGNAMIKQGKWVLGTDVTERQTQVFSEEPHKKRKLSEDWSDDYN